MSRERLVVVGGDAAGMSAAHQALRAASRSGHDLDVVAFERTGRTSYSACGIPYWVAGDLDDPHDLVARTPDEHRARGVDLRTGASVEAVDLDRREVRAHVDGSEVVVGFDRLVLATGARPVVPDWARSDSGALLPGVLPVKSWDDGLAWLDLMDRARPPARAVVVGAGYIGLEMAEALVRRGYPVTLLELAEVMPSIDADMGARVREHLVAAGVDVRVGRGVDGLTTGPGGRVDGVVVGDDALPADLVVLALGVRPASDLGAKAGLATGARGGYLPDDGQQVADGVWAAGDCCESLHRVSGERVFVPLGTHANKQGRVAGENAAGGSARFAGVLGTAITRFDAGGVAVEVARTGLGAGDVTRLGLDAASYVSPGKTASAYMPEFRPMTTKLVAERGTRRLLGGQIVGGTGAGKRIDTIAMALWAGLTVDDLAAADLAYAPPFATVWEAVQLAARRLADRMQ
ncbi:MAG: FAD-dependent oxidoreductase [Actinobacteria bacterium]|nr:FAD-dependent oxidoreductase [Actinomycetota bacterium]